MLSYFCYIIINLGTISQPPNILLTSIGAKIHLAQAFAELPQSVRGRLIGVDVNKQAAAACACDAFYVAPVDSDPGYHAWVQALLAREAIRLVVPTREAELRYWSSYDGSITLAAASPACLDITLDKWKMFHWLAAHGLPTPRCLTKKTAYDMMCRGGFPLPWVAKDPLGAGSRGVMAVITEAHVDAIPEGWLVQPKLLGQEYTINVYVDKSGQCRCIIPHRRDKVVGGEVQVGQTVDEPVLLALARELMALLPGVYGPLNFQVFWEGGATKPWITDINPRFGGGYVLCHAAGGRFAHWLVAEAGGHGLDDRDFVWQANLRLDRTRDPMVFID